MSQRSRSVKDHCINCFKYKCREEERVCAASFIGELVVGKCLEEEESLYLTSQRSRSVKDHCMNCFKYKCREEERVCAASYIGELVVEKCLEEEESLYLHEGRFFFGGLIILISRRLINAHSRVPKI
jgi:hypothetical protein